MKLKQATLCLILSFICLMQFAPPAFGQEVELGVAPQTRYVIMQPGRTVSVPVRLVHSGDPTFVELAMGSFVPVGERGEIVSRPFDESLHIEVLDSDVSLTEPFLMATDEAIDVNVTISAPIEASEREYYYSFLARSIPQPRTEGEISAQTSLEVASHIIVIVTKTGELDIEGRINRFTIIGARNVKFFGKQYYLVRNGDPIALELMLENTGKNLIRPTGTITVRGNFGEKAVHELTQHTVFPSGRRILETENNSSESRSMELNGFYIGFYQVGARVSLGDGAPVLFDQLRFIALPTKGVLIVLGLGAAVAVVYGIVRHKRRKHR